MANEGRGVRDRTSAKVGGKGNGEGATFPGLDTEAVLQSMDLPRHCETVLCRRRCGCSCYARRRH